MRIVLTSIHDELLEAWTRFCGDLPNVEIFQGSILEADCDAIVSPANSFGFMDGGLDELLLRHFGDGLQDRVQQMIFNQHDGELLVGTADIVETEVAMPRYIVVAPTMRVPMVLRDSVNPYLAARAALRCARRFASPIQSLAFPGLGTGVGQISPNVCAHQVAEAIRHVCLGGFQSPRTWVEASEQHQLLYGKDIRRLQHAPSE